MSFWTDIASGTVRLTPDQDAMLWKMRADGQNWPAIERRLRYMRRRPSADASARVLRCKCGIMYATHDPRVRRCQPCRKRAA